MSKCHEQTVEEHVAMNVAIAIDQAVEYGGLENAFYSLLENTYDSCIEDGYSPEEAFDAKNLFCVEFSKATGLEL